MTEVFFAAEADPYRRDVGCAVRTIEQESGMVVRAFGAHGAPYNGCTIVEFPGTPAPVILVRNAG